MEKEIYTEVCVLGAGPGGSMAAMFLAQQGVKILLVDKATFPRDKICGDALSGKVVEVIKKLDPSIIDRLDILPTQLGSWGVKFIAPNLTELNVPFRKNGTIDRSPPGYITTRTAFDHFLLKEAKQYNNIKVLEGKELVDFQNTGTEWRCTASDGSTIKTKLLVVADGAQSKFVRKIIKRTINPKQYCGGIRAYYKGVGGFEQGNFIELYFLKELLPGYFWIFPLPNGEANVGLGVRSDVISREKLNLKRLLDEVIQNYPSLKSRFASAKRMGDIKGYGLPLGAEKKSISGDNYMLVGDAASLIDPFTGEGIGNAMISGMFAAQQAAQCLSRNDFSASLMRSYDQKVYNRLWNELVLSRRMQQLVIFPGLFNLVVNKASKNKVLQETISCMFEDLDIRNRLKHPSFYLNLLFSN